MPGYSFDHLEIEVPTLLLDRGKALRNIAKIAGRAQASGVRFRPHTKTHQSAEIAAWFRDFGVSAITVSSLDMAAYFAAAGWNDITVAFPVNYREIDKINTLSERIFLNLIVDSRETINFLDTKLAYPVRIWIKVDVGYGRVGVHWEKHEKIRALASRIDASAKLQFIGLLAHAGHSYHARSHEEIIGTYNESLQRLWRIKEMLAGEGFERCEISVGDTPCCSVVERFEGIDEIRPGNFVFYDLKQSQIGSNTEEEIAVAVACPVVGKYRDGNRVVLYGGGAHLGRDSLVEADGGSVFGYLAAPAEQGWGAAVRAAPIVSLSQEHGIMRVDGELFEEIKIGGLLPILPVHACMTAMMHGHYLTLDGELIERFNG